MSPASNNPHIRLQDAVFLALYSAVQEPGHGVVASAANVTDRGEGWTKNYRIPDAVAYLVTSPAIDHGTHYQGGPDFALEVVSPGEDGRAKLGFYASVATREVLVIDRDPWVLTLYRRSDGVLTPVGPVGNVLVSETTRLTFALEAGPERPAFVVAIPGGRAWRV